MMAVSSLSYLWDGTAIKGLVAEHKLLEDAQDRVLIFCVEAYQGTPPRSQNVAFLSTI